MTTAEQFIKLLCWNPYYRPLNSYNLWHTDTSQYTQSTTEYKRSTNPFDKISYFHNFLRSYKRREKKDEYTFYWFAISDADVFHFSFVFPHQLHLSAMLKLNLIFYRTNKKRKEYGTCCHHIKKRNGSIIFSRFHPASPFQRISARPNKIIIAGFPKPDIVLFSSPVFFCCSHFFVHFFSLFNGKKFTALIPFVNWSYCLIVVIRFGAYSMALQTKTITKFIQRTNFLDIK